MTNTPFAYLVSICVVAAIFPWLAGCAKAEPQFHCYLLIGQSNMAGRGEVAEQDKVPHPRVFTLNKEDKWVPAADPIHFDKPFAGVGPGRTFGNCMAEADASVQIGLIPCAAGGSPISVWRKGEFWSQTKTRPYDEAIRRAGIARQRGPLMGILWHQGESDSNPKLAPRYAGALADLVARLRRDLGAPDLPFVVAGMSDALKQRNAHARKVDAELRRLPERVPNTAYVSAEGLKLKKDNIHFTAEAARELGRRYARAMLELQQHGASAPASDEK